LFAVDVNGEYINFQWLSSFSTSSLSSDPGCGYRSRCARSWSGSLQLSLMWWHTLSLTHTHTHTHTHTDAGVSFARDAAEVRAPQSGRACIACDSPRGVSMVAKDDPIHLMIRRATCSVDEPSARGRGARRELEVQLFNAVNDANYKI